VSDSLDILGYRCKNALINLRDGRRITAWYTPDIHQPAQARIEPVFAGIPGLVLQYEYTCRRRTVRYTATSLSRRPIDASVFAVP
jgi:GLPGLI family protein